MDFKQTDSGDLAIESNALTVVSPPDEARQRVIQRLRTVRGEYFLDRRIGVPYFEDIWKKQVNPDVVRSVIQSEILNTPGVIELQEFSADLASNRTLTVEFKMRVTQNEIIEVVEEL